MAGIYIPNCPDIPYGCRISILSDGHAYFENMTNPYGDLGEVIRVPDHGRLIDADALEADLNIWKGDYADSAFSETAIDEAPTIIPANKSGVWIDDGDCLICTTCKKAMDFHSKPDANGFAEYPSRCPHCGDCKHEVKKG